jgi:drug/metabolite transporter (DMT)-like permease
VTTADAHARRRGQVAVVAAAVAWSSAGPLQRLLEVDSATQIAGRALFAMVALFAYVGLVERTPLVGAVRGMGRWGLAFAGCTALASGAFIVALNHTTVANVLFIQAAAPVVAAVLAWALLGERVAPRTWAAIVLALVGVTVMIGAPGGGSLFGDTIAVVMMLAFSVGIVITRHRRDISMAPGTAVAQLVLVVVAAPLASPGSVDAGDWFVLGILGVFQIGLGLALLTIGARLLPAADVAVITLLEVVLGPLWVWLAFREEPGAGAIVGGLIVMVAVAVQAAGGRDARRRAASEPVVDPGCF